MMEEFPPSPSTVIAAYAQSFVEGRKVVVFGDCTSGLAEALVERGARLVHVYDSNVSRVAEATARGTSTEIAYAPLGQGGVAVRDGAFDVGVIDNMALADDPAALMARLRRALAARGVALVLCPNVEVDPVLLRSAEVDSGPSYYELYDIVSREFDEVRMVGQTPFVGYALADFTPGVADEFSIDTGFVQGGAEEPEWYLAIASHFPVAVDPFSVVQLPAASVLEACTEAGGRDLDAEERIAALSRELEDTHRKNASDDSKQLLLETKRELEKRDAWVHELEGRAAAADQRADDSEARAEEAEARADETEARAKKAEAQVRAAVQRATKAEVRLAELETKLKGPSDERAAAAVGNEARIKELEGRLKETQRRLSEAEARLADAADELRAKDEAAVRSAPSGEVVSLERKLARAGEKLDEKERALASARESASALSEELVRIEGHLRERGEAVAQLRRELAATERLAAELLAERIPLSDDVDDSGAQDVQSATTGTNGQFELENTGSLQALQANVKELAQVDARRVADLTAAQWTVQELENRLADQQAEARADIERLRAELQQQAALLAQVGKSPAA